MKNLIMKAVTILAAVTISTFPAFADPFPRLPGSVQVPSVVEGQAQVRNIWNCDPATAAAYRQSGLPYGDSPETISAIDRFVRSKIRYREDRGADVWSNFAAAALGGKRSVGDCEDFALTAITLALCAGVPDSKLGVVLSNQNRGRGGMSGINHAFAYYENGGRAFAFADTARSRATPVNVRRDGVSLWQSVPGMRASPGIFIPAVPTPGASGRTSRN